MPTIKELKEHLNNNYKDEQVVVCDIWSVEDVLEQAKNEGVKITQKQAEEVLKLIDRQKDATIGITWDTISDTIGIIKSN